MPRRTTDKHVQVRIIGGKWRGRKLRLASPLIRPSPDRARVTLFNWLAAELPGTRVLDLFAGTGVLGFEALSRGAKHVTFVENSLSAIDWLGRHQSLLDAADATVVRADALQWLASQPPEERWDVVFLDPPFDSSLLATTVRAVAEHLSGDGFIYAESGSDFDWEGTAAVAGLKILRHSKAGAVRYGLLGR